MGYNIIAELKNIAANIANISFPSIGTNIDGVSNAITNKTIPDNKTNIDGIATAINNKVIPDPSTNITSIATAINNKTIPDNRTNITAVATAINNKTIPDPNTQLGNIVTAVNNLSSMFGGKFYYLHDDNYTTSGTWGNYTDHVRQFALPSGSYGVGKTFMFIHNVWVHQTANTNFESKVNFAFGSGTIYLDTYGHVGSNGLWPEFNHIAFIKCDTNPTIKIRLCSAAAVSNIYSSYILVPLN